MKQHALHAQVLEREMRIDAEGLCLRADLAWPHAPCAMIVFVHGSGSGRRSPRNRMVAACLQRSGLATLLLDLLTEEEAARERHGADCRFDIERLAGRVHAATHWLAARGETANLPFGYFGASTGAAAALVAAAENPDLVRAVVSRGGRPDLAADALALVQASTLLIVGGNDPEVLELNRRALVELRCIKRLEVVPGATHLFSEKGTLERVASLARDWFLEHLGSPQVAEHAPR